jgi:hypothetical protein
MRRLLCSTLALLLAVIVGRDAALAHWRLAESGTAPVILANDPALRLRAVEMRQAGKARPQVSIQGETQAVHRAASDLLRQNPLDASALRKLAVIENQRRPGAGQNLVALAEQVSRRDLTTELLLIDSTAQQNDVAATLRHYDHVLLVYPAVKQQLFPLLASELGEADVRKALVPLASRPWLQDFAVNAVDYDVAPADLMDFYAEVAGKMPVTLLQDGSIRLIKWLQANKQSAAIGAFADRMPGISAGAFDQLGFTAATLDPHLAPLSWTFAQDEAVETENDGQTLTIRVSPENSGLVASRLTYFNPGKYELMQALAYSSDAPGARLDWQVTCLIGNAAPLWLLSLEPGAGRVSTNSRLTVPPACPAQTWNLRASSSPSQYPSQVRIVGLTLKRL